MIMNVFPKKIMLLGSGELGKEVAIAAKRLGCYVIACDRYNNAPAMQIADQFEVLDMNNDRELKEVIYNYKPDIIIVIAYGMILSSEIVNNYYCANAHASLVVLFQIDSIPV